MKEDEGMRKTESRVKCARGFVADDEPCCSWQAFVHNLRYNTDVSVSVSDCNKRLIDIGDPEFRKGCIEGRQQKCKYVEQESAKVSGLVEWRMSYGRLDLPVTTPPERLLGWILVTL